MILDWLRQLIPQKLINLFWHWPKAFLANIYYCWPAKKLKIIGVTGTDGKTTTASLIYHLLTQAGLKTGLISTVSVKIGRKEMPTGLHVTSADPWSLQKFLRQAVDDGYQYLVLEVTSHGLDQYRFFGVEFEIGVLTNVTHEHLDYHRTYQNYLAAKAKLLQKASQSVLNRDDRSFDYLKQQVMAENKIITYGKKSGDLNLKNFSFKTDLLGEYNQLNCLAAAAAAKQMGLKEELIKKGLRSFPGVIGRMEEIKTERGFRVFIDFAHTPNGLEKALQALRSLRPKRLIAVFGAAGLRDKEKRPMMGQIACRLADKIVLTAEDPRLEKVQEITKQIAAGCQQPAKLYREPDRQQAISLAINHLAKKGDIIGIFGKGHEQSMCFGKEERAWSDHQAAAKALKGD